MARGIDYNSQFTTDTDLPDIFGEEEMYYNAAMEALDDDVDKLESDAASDTNTKDTSGSNDNEESGGGDSEDLAAATDQQLSDDSQSSSESGLEDDSDLGSDDDSGDDSGDTDMGDDSLSGDSDTTGSDPLRSIETKSAYKEKFTKLYGVLVDSITTMEAFTPAYTNKSSAEYYEIENGLSRLKDIIYTICTERISKMTVDEVLRQYTLCNVTYDTLTRKLKEFTTKYNSEQKKLDVESRVRSAAAKLARGNKLLGINRPTTK